MPVIKRLEITKFRHLPRETYPLGKRITVIAGHNATGKSTLLAMLAQPFGVADTDIMGHSLRTKINDIFKLSPQYDKPGEHLYFVETYEKLHSDGLKVQIKSFGRKDRTNLRFVTGKKRERGDGNIDIPVCYLGLKRVFPLGELSSPSLGSHTLTEDEQDFFKYWHSKILQETHAITPQRVSSKKEKDTLGIQTEHYDSHSISAGQDNVGQILGAVISLQRYKKSKGSDYLGSLLIIDEVDITLHAASQNSLIDLLYKQSRESDFQVVVTTHSPYFIKAVREYHSTRNGDCNIWYLKKPFGNTVVNINPTNDEIYEDVTLTSGVTDALPKINVYVEDKQAEQFLKRLLGTKISRRCKVIAAKISCKALRGAAHIKELENAVFVLDGDQGESRNDPNTLVRLPGGTSPEKLFASHLDSLSDDDPFWSAKYTKMHFINNKPSNSDNREVWKNWLENEKRNWGNGMCRICKSWTENHTEEREQFIKKFVKAFNCAAKRKTLPLHTIEEE